MYCCDSNLLHIFSVACLMCKSPFVAILVVCALLCEVWTREQSSSDPTDGCYQTRKLQIVEAWLSDPTSANFTHCEHSAHGQEQCLTVACATQDELSRNTLSCTANVVVEEVVLERSAFTMAIDKTWVIVTIPEINSYVGLNRTKWTTKVVVKKGRRSRQSEFINCADRMITQRMIRWIRTCLSKDNHDNNQLAVTVVSFLLLWKSHHFTKTLRRKLTTVTASWLLS